MLLVLLTAYRRGVLLNLALALPMPLWLTVHDPWVRPPQVYGFISVFSVLYLLPLSAGLAARDRHATSRAGSSADRGAG